MALIEVRRTAQITLTAAIRKQLEGAEGDYLEAAVVESKVVLEPLSAGDRARAWHQIRRAPRSVRYVGPEPRPSPEEEERMIFEVVEAVRHRRV
jgi:bifunctional DNA-binding transcriptional regulator/antitoxin component of YhaV-PrlF toxin-antitoxin module